MQHEIDQFKIHLSRRHSPLTIDAYSRDMRRVLRDLSEQLGRPATAADLTGAVAQDWLDRAPLCVRTRRRYLTSLRAWFKWRKKTGQGPDEGHDLETPRDKSYRLPKVLTLEEADRLVEAPIRLGSGRPRLDARDSAFMELLYATGLRRSEAVSLTAEALEFRQEGYAALRVVGKGDKERLVIVEGGAPLVALQRYLEHRPSWPGASCSAALFLGYGGKPLGRSGAGEIVRRWGRAVGLRAHPHLLRHCFATHLVAACGERLRGVQELMGHADPRTTALYAQIDEARLRRTARRHPRAGRPPPEGSAR